MELKQKKILVSIIGSISPCLYTNLKLNYIEKLCFLDFFCYYFEVNGVLFICFEILYVVKWLHFGGLALWTQLLSNSEKPGSSCSAATERPFGESWGQRRGRDVRVLGVFLCCGGAASSSPKLRSRVRTCPHLLHILGHWPEQVRGDPTPFSVHGNISFAFDCLSTLSRCFY